MVRIQGDLLERTTRFAEQIVMLIDLMPNNVKGWELGKQLIRSGTSIGANLREADHGLSDSDFAHKCSLSREEASETFYWLDLCMWTNLLPDDRASPLLKEADELVRILQSIVRGTQNHIERSR